MAAEAPPSLMQPESNHPSRSSSNATEIYAASQHASQHTLLPGEINGEFPTGPNSGFASRSASPNAGGSRPPPLFPAGSPTSNAPSTFTSVPMAPSPAAAAQPPAVVPPPPPEGLLARVRSLTGSAQFSPVRRVASGSGSAAGGGGGLLSQRAIDRSASSLSRRFLGTASQTGTACRLQSNYLSNNANTIGGHQSAPRSGRASLVGLVEVEAHEEAFARLAANVVGTATARLTETGPDGLLASQLQMLPHEFQDELGGDDSSLGVVGAVQAHGQTPHATPARSPRNFFAGGGVVAAGTSGATPAGGDEGPPSRRPSSRRSARGASVFAAPVIGSRLGSPVNAEIVAPAGASGGGPSVGGALSLSLGGGVFGVDAQSEEVLASGEATTPHSAPLSTTYAAAFGASHRASRVSQVGSTAGSQAASIHGSAASGARRTTRFLSNASDRTLGRESATRAPVVVACPLMRLVPLEVLRFMIDFFLSINHHNGLRLVCRRLNLLVTSNCSLWQRRLPSFTQVQPGLADCRIHKLVVAIRNHEASPTDFGRTFCFKSCCYDTWHALAAERADAQLKALIHEDRAFFTSRVSQCLFFPQMTDTRRRVAVLLSVFFGAGLLASVLWSLVSPPRTDRTDISVRFLPAVVAMIAYHPLFWIFLGTDAAIGVVLCAIGCVGTDVSFFMLYTLFSRSLNVQMTLTACVSPFVVAVLSMTLINIPFGHRWLSENLHCRIVDTLGYATCLSPMLFSVAVLIFGLEMDRFIVIPMVEGQCTRARVSGAVVLAALVSPVVSLVFAVRHIGFGELVTHAPGVCVAFGFVLLTVVSVVVLMLLLLGAAGCAALASMTGVTAVLGVATLLISSALPKEEVDVPSFPFLLFARPEDFWVASAEFEDRPAGAPAPGPA